MGKELTVVAQNTAEVCCRQPVGGHLLRLEIAAPKNLFPLQHVTLTIIILSFLIGSFTLSSSQIGKGQDHSLNQKGELKATGTVRVPLTKMEFRSLHRGWRLNRNGVELSALKGILSQHDVVMDMTIFFNESSGEDLLRGQFLPAMLLLASLNRHLVEAGVPPDALRINARSVRGLINRQAEAWISKSPMTDQL